jgi:hypothetical protein
LATVDSDHNCPIAWAFDHGLADEAFVSPSWCWNTYQDAVANLSDPVRGDEVTHSDLLLWQDGRLSVYYTPFDWVNTRAKVLIVGITPGRAQALAALRRARQGLHQGLSAEELLRYVDADASFSGPMRRNLVDMLDGIGLADALGIESASEIFGAEHHELAGLCSAVSYPVFRDGENYRGAPAITRTPRLRALMVAMLGATVGMADDPLVIPLGKAATEAVDYLVNAQYLKPSQRLEGFPHPSGANGHRVAQYVRERKDLAFGVRQWFEERRAI